MCHRQTAPTRRALPRHRSGRRVVDGAAQGVIQGEALPRGSGSEGASARCTWKREPEPSVESTSTRPRSPPRCGAPTRARFPAPARCCLRRGRRARRSVGAAFFGIPGPVYFHADAAPERFLANDDPHAPFVPPLKKLDGVADDVAEHDMEQAQARSARSRSSGTSTSTVALSTVASGETSSTTLLIVWPTSATRSASMSPVPREKASSEVMSVVTVAALRSVRSAISPDPPGVSDRPPEEGRRHQDRRQGIPQVVGATRPANASRSRLRNCNRSFAASSFNAQPPSPKTAPAAGRCGRPGARGQTSSRAARCAPPTLWPQPP